MFSLEATKNIFPAMLVTPFEDFIFLAMQRTACFWNCSVLSKPLLVVAASFLLGGGVWVLRCLGGVVCVVDDCVQFIPMKMNPVQK